MRLLIAGVILGTAILGLVHQISLFGATCYYVGDAPNTCIQPILYYAALAVAALFVILGIINLIRKPVS